jgi:MFS family permease
MSKHTAQIHPAQVLFPLGLGTALSLMGDATLYTVLPTHTADAGITLGSVGIILGVNRAARLFLNGPAGLAYDRWPRRRLFLPALFVGALSTAVYAATRGFWPLFMGRLLWGLAWSGIWVGGATMILDVATAQDRGQWMGLYQTWFFLGAALGSLGGGVFTDRLGYTATMWIGAALTGLGGVVAWLLLPETRTIRETTGADQAGDRHTPNPDPPPVDVKRPRLRANGRLWFAASLQGVNRFVISGMMLATMGLLVQDRLQPAGTAIGVATLTGILIFGRTLLSMAAAPLAGTLSDRMGSRWTVTAWGLAAGTTGMLLLAWGAPVAILAGILVVAVSGGSVQALATTLAGDLVSPAQRGRAIGLLHTSGDFGSAIGPSVAYALLPWIGLHGVYLLCAALFAASLVLTLCFRGGEQARVSLSGVQSQ